MVFSGWRRARRRETGRDRTKRPVLWRRWAFFWLVMVLGLGGAGEVLAGGFDLAVYGEIPLNQRLGIPLDQGTGPGHGIVFFQYTDQEHVGEGNQLRVGLNTETVWLAWDLGATSRRALVVSPYLKGQFGFAEMTPDYIKAGAHLRDLSFYSMSAEAGVELRLRLVPTLFLAGSLALRYWFFLQSAESGEAGFRLPPNSPALRSSLSLSWERMDTQRQRGRLRHGLRMRATVEVNRRFFQQPWGGLSTPVVDRRNATPSAYPNVRVMAEAEGSVCVHPRICLMLDASGGMGWFGDDLQRFKIGGDNVYVPMLSGTYFAEFVVDAFFLAHARFAFLPWMWWRITPQVDVAWIPDPLRTGNRDERRWILGLGLNLDFFLRDNLRIHVKVAYSPNAPRPTRDGGFKTMIGFVGYWW